MTTVDTVTSEIESFAPSVATDVASPSLNKFQQYCKDKDVRQVMVLVPNALGDMLKAIETRDNIKESDLVRNIFTASVNMYGLTHIVTPYENPEWAYEEPWTYTPPAPKPVSTAAKLAETKKELSAAQQEIEALKAQLAAMTMRVPPTPPTIHADPKTGKLVAS